MSRIGRQPIPVPAGVTVAIEPESVRVNGPKGELSERIHRDIEVTHEGERLLVSRPTNRGEHRALHGLTRSLVANMVQGVTEGYAKELEIVGVGYRATAQGPNKIEVLVGFSHPVHVEAPEGVTFEVPQPTRITVRGFDKQLVGQVAADIRKLRKPEPYKGKGIRYAGERVLRKAGKSAK
jgi:large subunit ribosomal protein L6